MHDVDAELWKRRNLMISQAAREAVSYATYYDITVYNYDITYSKHHIA